MPSRTTTRHPSGWIGAHYFVNGNAWSGCHQWFLAEHVKGNAFSYHGKFNKTAPHDACAACLSFMHGRKSVIREVNHRGEVPTE